MKIGIQSNVWGPDRHEDLDGILAEIAAAGYDGVEIGAHRLDLDDPAGARALLAKHTLVAALHVHAELHNSEAVSTYLPPIERAIGFAGEIEAPFVLISGKAKRNKSAEELALQGRMLNQIGQKCADAGVKLLYHNHFWEIEADLREYRSIVSSTDPELLSLAMDVGWVKRAGQNPLEVIPEFLNRLAYFHLKDFRVYAPEEIREEWTDMGEGYVRMPEVVELIKKAGDFWLTYERDGVLPNAGENAWKNREILRKLGV